MASLTSRSNQLLSWSKTFLLCKFNVCWWLIMCAPSGDVSFRCSEILCCTPDKVLIRVLIRGCRSLNEKVAEFISFSLKYYYIYVLKNKRNRNILDMKYNISGIQQFKFCTPDEIRCINENNYSNKKKIISSCYLLKGELTCVLMK